MDTSLAPSSSRWRPAARARLGRPAGAADRVRRTHEQTRRTLRVALGFMAAAAVAALVAGGEGRWLPLHLFLTGGVVLAISGVSLMLTVTWAAAPAPPERLASLQRWSVASGAAAVVAGRVAEATPLLILGGVAYAGGLVLLGTLLVTTVRRGVEWRFDPAVAAYVLALVAALVAAGLGVAMAGGDAGIGVRRAHLTLNLFGFVGIVIAGTLPYFAATSARSKMAPRATAGRLIGATTALAAAVATAATAFAADAPRLAGAALVAYGATLCAVSLLLPVPTRRQLRWAGPRLVALWAGTAWWTAAAVATGAAALGDSDVLSDAWLEVLVVGGFFQIVWGALAYLLPVLRGGGHERLSKGFATTRSWLAPVALNTAALALLGGARGVAGIAVAVFALDAAYRVVRIGGLRHV